jgi:hypothetical protein
MLCTGFHAIPRERNGRRVMLAQLGGSGETWFGFFSTSMEGNVLDKLETS